MDRNSYEKLSISESARSLKKYGSTSRHVTKNENYIKHYVTNTDTLQGIALKYDVTIEQIRRANRMFANDSLFLREHLLIPVPESKSHLVSPVQSPEMPSTSSNRSQEAESDDENISNFLGKIDAAIASTKEGVKKVQGNSEFVTGTDFDNGRKKPTVSRMKHSVNNNGVRNHSTTPQAVVIPPGRKMRSSIQRLEQQQDELFEL